MKVRQKITLHLLLYIGLSSVVFAQPVHMPDQNLRSLIIETLDLPQNHTLTRQDMLKLENLDAGGNRNITNLMGLEFAINIATLGLYHNPIEDIGPLADMTKMTGFNLWGCLIVDLSPLRDLQNLNWIVLGNNQVSDISPLAGLINLTTFHVDSNQIVDISPLTSLTRLEELRLNRNSITDITPLTKLKNLQKLHLADNPFHDFSPLFELEGVELDIEISEEFNAIVEVPDPNLRLLIREALSLPETVPLTQGQMQRLTTLDAGGDRGINDLTALEYATNLQFLGLYANPIVDISPLTHLTMLEGFNLWGCRVVDLSPLRNLTNLRWIGLGNNQISDLSPLSELTNLISLELASNQISDVTPLTGLRNLKKLHLADNPFHNFSPLFELEGVEFDIEISEEFNVVVELPDPNLRLLIREALSLPETVPLTQGQMQRLTQLDAGGDRGIANLTGLEYATNLRYFGLYDNPIVEISPLTHLTKLEGLNLWGCLIVDLRPLRNLTNLRWIVLGGNQISDISPLAGLTNLFRLHLENNHIVDFSPVANLVKLEELWINNNLGTDFSQLANLNLIDFRYDEVCDIEPFPPVVRERLENRSFPSVFQMYDDVIGLDHLTQEQRTLLHDLHWLHWISFPTLHWNSTPTKSTYGLATSYAGDLAGAREVRQWQLDQNPNLVFLREVKVQLHDSVRPDAFPPDSEFWLRDAHGQIIRNSYNENLINFLKPEVQELIIKRIIAIEQCGLFDGIFLDGFNHNGAGFVGRHFFPFTDEEIIQAMLNIFRTVRSQVRDDFLILINTNRSKATRYAEFVNGTFMETLTDNHYSDQPGGYTHVGLAEIEDTLTWSEENLRSPQINCLEGWGIPTEPPDSQDNLRWMRVFTTMSLTHSDGYVLYTTGTGVFRLPDPGDQYPYEPSHEHIWYPFWDADLGQPVGPKAQLYENTEGIFIREFTKGWVVYNRSGNPQIVTLPERVQSVRSGLQHSQHAVPDLDGDIYLRVKPANPADVNSDGVVNIFDLTIVAQGFGKDSLEADVNGDGVVNVFDLVFVAGEIQ